MSENSVFQQQQQQLRQQQRQSPPPSINTSSTLSFIPNALFSPLSPTAPTSPSSPGSASSGNGTALTAVDETFDRGGAASSMPSFFMPTGLSLHNAFEGARRRSMSYGSTNATSLK
ncbi:hypothetical protein VTP01DRAFT_9427 [Rhizomucor pusillus]|uniref:uncharacterized protein n=1 Tax=Rhizomucor pusillus TaxID=4840 RepID=UPI003742AC63